MKGTPTNKKRALIVGSGIGGPVAAMALQRAGIEVVVYEAYDAPADYAGLFLNTASNTAWTCCAPSASTCRRGRTASPPHAW